MTEISEQEQIEKIWKQAFYELDTVVSYQIWVKNFALNLQKIWNGYSSKSLSENGTEKTAIVIGRGPSLKKFDHLKKLLESKFDGMIICCDGALITTLKAGITPKKFKNFFVVTIDPREDTRKFYDDEIVDLYGNEIKGIFSTVSNPITVERAEKAGIELYWMHSLVDYNDGEKSFNQISALMTRAKNHINGLPAIQTGGNVGTSAWFVGWKILKCSKIVLIGINHGWEESDSLEKILTHNNTCKKINIQENSASFKKLFPKIYNPNFKSYCILDPIFQYYSSGFKEFIRRSPNEIITINATEGGSIFGERIQCMKFEEFLKEYN